MGKKMKKAAQSQSSVSKSSHPKTSKKAKIASRGIKKISLQDISDSVPEFPLSEILDLVYINRPTSKILLSDIRRGAVELELSLVPLEEIVKTRSFLRKHVYDMSYNPIVLFDAYLRAIEGGTYPPEWVLQEIYGFDNLKLTSKTGF
jgi:hypothetical protein